MTPTFRIYLITDRRLCPELGDALREILRELPPRLAAVQLRENDLPARELLALARELRAITREHQAGLLINDRLDIARLADADGVQLGRRSPSVDAVRAVWPEAVIGASCHDPGELETAARRGADFALLSPVFAPRSKPETLEPLGIERFTSWMQAAALPIFALGGVDQATLEAVMGTGCFGVALIGGWLSSSAERIRISAKLRKFFVAT